MLKMKAQVFAGTKNCEVARTAFSLIKVKVSPSLSTDYVYLNNQNHKPLVIGHSPLALSLHSHKDATLLSLNA